MATIFRDEFTGTGLIADHTPDVGYGGTYYINFTQTVLSGGFVTFDNSAGGDTSGGLYGDNGDFLGLLTEGTYSVVFRTLAGVPPVTEFGAECTSLTYGYGGETWGVRVGFFPDGTCFMSGIDEEAFLLEPLESDTTYTLTVTFTGEYQIIRLEELGVQKVIYYGPAGYDDPDPMLGIGDTSFGVGNYGKIDRIELVDAAILAPEDDTAEDGMDEGVGEDSADTLNSVSVDVVEAGVGDDLPLVDGEVAPEDVREAGLAADATDTQLNANQTAKSTGRGADFALPIEPPVTAVDAGVASDSVTGVRAVNVFEAGVVEGLADPLGGSRLLFDEVFDDGVAADDFPNAGVKNGLGQSAGIAADQTPNDYYAVPRDNGVAVEATSHTVLANQIALDAGIADATTDTRILEDARDFGLAADSTSLAVALDARSTGVGVDFALVSQNIAATARSTGVAADEAIGRPAYLDSNIADAGVAADATTLARSVTARDTGMAADVVLASASRNADIRDAGVASDTPRPLSFVDVREDGVAADVTLARVRTIQNVREAGVAVDAADPRRASQVHALSSGVATDASNTQLVAYSTIVEAGVADDTSLFSRLYEAWVMNTQTSAMSRYTSLPFNSAAVIGGRVIGLGDGGFFELGGTTDAGKPINALMKSGHMTLQSDKIKRLDDVTVGYTSTGTLQVTVAAYGGPLKGRWTYTAPPTDAISPRSNRLTLGRGLQAKYYQFTIENTKGAAMSLDFARVISNEFKSRRF